MVCRGLRRTVRSSSFLILSSLLAPIYINTYILCYENDFIIEWKT